MFSNLICNAKGGRVHWEEGAELFLSVSRETLSTTLQAGNKYTALENSGGQWRTNIQHYTGEATMGGLITSGCQVEARDCVELHYTILYKALYCTVLNCTVLQCTVLHSIAQSTALGQSVDKPRG